MGKAWPALDIHIPGCDPQLQDLVLAELDDFQPTAIQEPNESAVLRAFFTTGDLRDAAARALASSFGSHLYVESLNIEDEDWAARSQAQLRAITVGRITVCPPWHQKRGLTPLLVLIQPSMGFGTGHHATTRLMLRAVQDLPLEGRTVLDIGCGSGVLAFAAVKLGSHSAVGIDIDPDALTNAVENLEINNLADRVSFEKEDFRAISRSADVVMANLTGALLERSAEQLAARVNPGGYLIVSGFMQSEEGSVVPALKQFLTFETIDREDEWLCAVFRSTGL
ncbi:MAG TPA: 50S ribosomal protein L11 methyltransferase [Vicinamibacterales bacterium]|nr:50S ribosomal protein L11 methyltransferase [Vicinamibacterales bacterium]